MVTGGAPVAALHQDETSRFADLPLWVLAAATGTRHDDVAILPWRTTGGFLQASCIQGRRDRSVKALTALRLK